MRTNKHKVDKQLLFTIILIVFSGFFIFASASLGLLARNNVSFSSVAMKQFLLGIVLGGILLLVASKINYRLWKKFSIHFFILSLIATAAVFLPVIGFTSGGATRWISIGPLTFQPAELLKIATVLFTASYLAKYRTKIDSFKYGLGAIGAILLMPAMLLLSQPDTGTLIVIVAALGAMFLSAGAKWRDIGILIVFGIVLLGILIMVRPYVLDRITTFLHPEENSLTSGYQIQQSLIAVGSGGFFGRGFGQSVQKFNYLPEPTTDSIFAVAAEEFGFIGGAVLILMFLFFLFRTMRISTRTPDYFSAFTVLGLGILIAMQAFLNIAAMLGVAPLTGMPLPFISQGGTALATMLASVGIILNISRFAKK